MASPEGRRNPKLRTWSDLASLKPGLDGVREQSEALISDPPSVDYAMSVAYAPPGVDVFSLVMYLRFTASGFGGILASFSEGEWSDPVNYFTER